MIFLLFSLALFPLELPFFTDTKEEISKVCQEKAQELLSQRRQDLLLFLEEGENLSDFCSYRYPFFTAYFHEIFSRGELTLSKDGCSGTYFLLEKDTPKFIIKPFDEHPRCLHNPRTYASIFLYEKDLPLYHSPEREALAYEIARILHLTHLTPFTTALVLESDTFHTLEEKEQRKLCSVQEYLPAMESLSTVLEELLKKGYEERSLEEFLDKEDFEDLALFLWLTYDNDAHFSNFLVYPKKMSADGKLIYRIKKIDNAQCFPEKNTGYLNHLLYLPMGGHPLSNRTKQKIALLPLEEMIEAFHLFHLSDALPAFLQRVSVLQEASKEWDISYYEVNQRLQLKKNPSVCKVP